MTNIGIDVDFEDGDGSGVITVNGTNIPLMSTAADRAAAFLQDRAARGNTRHVIAFGKLYPTPEDPALTVEDLQELVAIAQDLQKAERDIKAVAWDEGAKWMWEAKEPPAPRDNPYRD